MSPSCGMVLRCWGVSLQPPQSPLPQGECELAGMGGWEWKQLELGWGWVVGHGRTQGDDGWDTEGWWDAGGWGGMLG